MDIKNLSLPNTLVNAAQNISINISLQGWPATVAIWAVCGTIVGVAAIYASVKAKTDKSSKKKETPSENKLKCNNVSAEGSSE